MPIEYTMDVKGARMDATRRKIDGGSLQLFGMHGLVLFDVKLGTPCGLAIGGTLRINGMPKHALAVASGRIIGARIMDANYNAAVLGLTVGFEKEKDIVLISTRSGTMDVALGDLLQLNEFDLLHA